MIWFVIGVLWAQFEGACDAGVSPYEIPTENSSNLSACDSEVVGKDSVAIKSLENFSASQRKKSEIQKNQDKEKFVQGFLAFHEKGLQEDLTMHERIDKCLQSEITPNCKLDRQMYLEFLPKLHAEARLALGMALSPSMKEAFWDKGITEERVLQPNTELDSLGVFRKEKWEPMNRSELAEVQSIFKDKFRPEPKKPGELEDQDAYVLQKNLQDDLSSASNLLKFRREMQTLHLGMSAAFPIMGNFKKEKIDGKDVVQSVAKAKKDLETDLANVRILKTKPAGEVLEKIFSSAQYQTSFELYLLLHPEDCGLATDLNYRFSDRQTQTTAVSFAGFALLSRILPGLIMLPGGMGYAGYAWSKNHNDLIKAADSATQRLVENRGIGSALLEARNGKPYKSYDEFLNDQLPGALNLRSSSKLRDLGSRITESYIMGPINVGGVGLLGYVLKKLGGAAVGGPKMLGKLLKSRSEPNPLPVQN